MNIRPAGAQLYIADGQTDVTKLIVNFRNFANAHNDCDDNDAAADDDENLCT